jgi:Ca2+/Na+ antiporter
MFILAITFFPFFFVLKKKQKIKKVYFLLLCCIFLFVLINIRGMEGREREREEAKICFFDKYQEKEITQKIALFFFEIILIAYII